MNNRVVSWLLWPNPAPSGLVSTPRVFAQLAWRKIDRPENRHSHQPIGSLPTATLAPHCARCSAGERAEGDWEGRAARRHLHPIC